MKYFAYGSNMDPVQMARRCPGSRSLGRARLADHRLAFTYDSVRWGGGVGTVLPVQGEETWGVLWDLDEDHVESLDRYEQIADDVYRRTEVIVQASDGPCEAMMYVATDRRHRRPSRRYVRALLRGARAHDFPAHYISALEQVRAVTPEEASQHR